MSERISLDRGAKKTKLHPEQSFEDDAHGDENRRDLSGASDDSDGDPEFVILATDESKL